MIIYRTGSMPVAPLSELDSRMVMALVRVSKRMRVESNPMEFRF